MSKNRSQKPNRKRTVDVREERKATNVRELLTFSFKDLDQTQPKKSPETLGVWSDKDLLPKLFERLMHLAKLTRSEAVNGKHIEQYGQFPDKDKTEFSIPSHVPLGANWSVIKRLGGRIRVAGYLIENTFYIVFLDSEHKFFLSKLKHT